GAFLAVIPFREPFSTTDGAMNHDQSTLRRFRRPALYAERLETRGLLSAGFPTGLTTVNDHAGFASIGLPNLPFQLDSTTAPPLSVYLSYSGTAVPGVDYTPITQPIAFTSGQDSAPAQIPILPGTPSEGSRLLEIDLSPAPGAPPTNAAFVLITHNADTTPPNIIATRMVTRGPYVKKFVITFSKDMAPGPIQDVSNYAIADPRSVRPVPG